MSEEHPTILFIGAHDMDFLVRAGGTMANYQSRGSRVVALSMSMGERQESARLWREQEGLTIEECKKIKEKESQQCADVLGAETVFYDWEDSPLVIDRERLNELARVIREVRPEILITHYPWEKHAFADHRIAGEAAVRAAGIAGAAGALRETGLETWGPRAIYYAEPAFPGFAMHNFDPNVFVDITESWERKLSGLQVSWSHGVLVESYTNCALLRGYQAKRTGGAEDCKYGEAFVVEYNYAGKLLPFPVSRGVVS
jgi:4-oxalomesaconate hydratase